MLIGRRPWRTGQLAPSVPTNSTLRDEAVRQRVLLVQQADHLRLGNRLIARRRTVSVSRTRARNRCRLFQLALDCVAPALPTPTRSNPTSVEISASAEQQYHEDNDEQSGRVHFLSYVFWRSRSRVMESTDARDEHWGFGSSRSGSRQLQMCRLTAVQAVVCPFLNIARQVSVAP